MKHVVKIFILLHTEPVLISLAVLRGHTRQAQTQKEN